MEPTSSEKNLASSYYENYRNTENEDPDDRRANLSASSDPIYQKKRNVSNLYHGTWPVEQRNGWNSGAGSLEAAPSGSDRPPREMASVMSFASSSGGAPLERVLNIPDSSRLSQQLEAKVDMVYSLLAMLGGQEHADMGETLLALSTNPESCIAMRQSGCIPLLVQLVQSDKDSETRKKASKALHNLVCSQPDEKIKKRESKILKLLENVSCYCEALRNNIEYTCQNSPDDGEKHPVQTVAHLMKLSFDDDNRRAICQFGGIYTIARLIEMEHISHGTGSDEAHCILLRRYSCMALTNLTFGDSGNKALLCSYKEFVRALVLQLKSPSDELRQVTASVLRNLSWRADSTSKEVLKEAGSVSGLMRSAMLNNKENTLKSILSALWNLSAHCTENKAEICALTGALGFLVQTLSYKSQTKSLAVIENAGGILRNISSQIALRDDYREILREQNCLSILLEQLKSPSLTIVSNACGTLWNLSAKNASDQNLLWQLGAPAMLRSLSHSKHKMIAMGSSATLKNLLSARPNQMLSPTMDSVALSLNLPELPTLGARKQRALLKDLDQNLSETYDNVEQSKDDKIKNVDILNSSFTSLNINDNFTEISPQCGSVSLPYMDNIDHRTCFIPRRNNFSQRSYEDEVATVEEPFDFSIKYSETTKTTQKKFDKVKPENKSFSMYAETDLDQPTDYSLRYAEDDSDNEMRPNLGKTEFVNDTIKTYCTEGTPYETPLNFSTATSMSDLQIDDKKNAKIKETKVSDEKDRCSTEDLNEEKIKMEFNSGLMTPEKPTRYCEEGTPQYFSRVSSCGSLNSLPIKKEEDKLKKAVNVKVSSKESSPKLAQAESKAVKFESNVNYAEETPLMFSRSSSLGSLGSMEPQSIHDDRSSVISDFSRLTSGIISPSEIPDSPTQTVPPSPKPKMTNNFSPSSALMRNMHKPGVFEDNVKKFKEESTPAQFSMATSLSSLTIDENDDAKAQSFANQQESVEDNTLQKGESVEKEDIEKEKEQNIAGSLPDSDDESDEDILAACINEGMQNNRHSQPNQNVTRPPLISYNKQLFPLKTDKKLPKPHVPLKNRLKSETTPDTLHTYCTEGTPAFLSHAGSNSDLSILSSCLTDGKSKKEYLSDDSSNLSGDNDNILAECIQSAMPKTKREINRIVSPKGGPIKFNIDERANGNARSKEAPQGCSKDNYKPVNRSVNLPPYLSARDETTSYGVENSPQQFSLRSSLSDLTVDNGSVAGLKRNCINLPSKANGTPSKPFSAESSDVNNPRPISRNESVSSLSIESFGSIEAEQALLEQCISSGMPKNKHTVGNEMNPEVESVPKNFMQTKLHADPKNLNVASVVRKVNETNNPEQIPPAAADVTTEPEQNPSKTVREDAEKNQTPQKNNGCSAENPERIYDELETSCTAGPDNRMLDPAAMIESLDRFTAKLISQSSHLQSNLTCSEHTLNDNTWDESCTNQISFPSITESSPKVITFNSDHDIVDGPKINSNDFSSINTSTLTDSTLIAMEATKVAAAFKFQADMSTSANSLASLELDKVQPPSLINSLSNSGINLELPKSPKLIRRKKSLPSNAMFRKALNNSISNTGSLEKLCNDREFSEPNCNNLNVFKANFIVNGPINKEFSTKISHNFNPSSMLNLVRSDEQGSITDLENINPPSLLNEITDMCNSLADVATSVICSDSEAFEDCCSQLVDLDRTDNDFTEFDSNNATPIPSDFNSSSNENTPKKQKNKHLTSKQKRVLARERYKTYTIATEMILKASSPDDFSTEENYKTVNCSETYQSVCESTFSIKSKTSPKDKRLNNKSRYETRVLDPTEISQLKSLDSSESKKVTNGKSLMQRRLLNKDRYKTQVVNSNFSKLPDSGTDSEMYLMVQKEADIVLKTLNETNPINDDLLECETMSLVSNDEESEQNCRGPVNYKTYHKSWSCKPNLPIITGKNDDQEISDDYDENQINPSCSGRPKIIKPDEIKEEVDENSKETPKAVRGRRKPLYSKSPMVKVSPKSMTPLRNISSNLVKNVTTTLKSGASLKDTSKLSPKTPKLQIPQKSNVKSNISPKKVASSNVPSPKSTGTTPKSPRPTSNPPLERQNTFTKDDSTNSQTKSKIPGLASKIPSMKPPTSGSKIPSRQNSYSSTNKKNVADQTPRSIKYNRSTSADSRESQLSRKIQTSLSTHSLKMESPKSNGMVNGKKSTVLQKDKSSSNSSLNASPKKQVTSKIASLWKKIEESKLKAPVKDTKVWIEAQPVKNNGDVSEIILRNNAKSDDQRPKRLSRLGSFVAMDETQVIDT